MGWSAALHPGCAPAVEEVAAGSATPLSRRAWFDDGGTGALRTLVIRDAAGRPVVALPLRTRGPLRTMPGSYWPFRSAPVAADVDPDAVAGAFRSPAARRALGLVARIGPLLDGDPLMAVLRRAAPAAGRRLLERPAGRCFVLRAEKLLAGDRWPHASADKRNAARERRLAESGAVEWRFLHGADWTPALFDELAAVERASWKGVDGQTKFADGRERARWERRAADPVLAATMRLCLLRVGGRPAAFSFDLDAGSVRYGVCSAYDGAHHRHSPGRLLHYRSLSEAIGRGVRFVNWGAGDSGYKRELGAEPGPTLVDCLLVRDLPGLVAMARRVWTA